MIGIIGALESEVKQLIESVTSKKQAYYAGAVFCSGKLGGKEVVIAKCGIGKVCAAICAQVMIDIYHADTIINTGVAGGLNPDLEIGDFVIADTLIQHDFDLSSFGYAKGYMPCEEVYVRTPDKNAPTKYICDQKLVKQFISAAKLSGCSRTSVGCIVSADMFVSDPIKKDELVKKYSAFAVEMEGAAIAQTAALSRIPFVVIRAISDLADKDAGVSFDKFEESAASLSSRILIRMLSSIA